MQVVVAVVLLSPHLMLPQLLFWLKRLLWRSMGQNIAHPKNNKFMIELDMIKHELLISMIEHKHHFA